MKYARLVVSIPLMAFGAVFLGIGILAVVAGRYLSPEMTTFDLWIDGAIEGSKDHASQVTPSPRLAA
jgi:hypothetical protein